MMRTAAFIFTILVLISCTPYVRYGNGAHQQEQQPSPQRWALTVNDYIKLGTIIRGKLGTPYAGTSKYKMGTDCSNLTQQVYAEFNGISLGRTAQDQFSNGTLVARNRLQFGDLVFFSLKKNRITHVGIYVGYDQFIHASENYGVILSRLSDKYWSHSFAGARRILQMPARPDEKPKAS